MKLISIILTAAAMDLAGSATELTHATTNFHIHMQESGPLSEPGLVYTSACGTACYPFSREDEQYNVYEWMDFPGNTVAGTCALCQVHGDRTPSVAEMTPQPMPHIASPALMIHKGMNRIDGSMNAGFLPER